jgi:hypothetical protein
MNNKSFYPLVLIFALASTTLAQNATKYVIQLGATSSINLDKLQALSDIGNVYFNPLGDKKEHEILLGSFENVSKAEAVIQNLDLQKFGTAYVAPLPLSKGIEVYVIQLAKFNNHEDINWDRYKGKGKIYTTIEQGEFSIVTGVFPDYQSSLKLQNDLFNEGFTSAEVVKINSIYLHEVNLKDISFQQKLQLRPVGLASEFTAKGGAVMANAKEETPPIVSRVALAKAIAPAINEDLARNSVKNLQSVLLIFGTYNDEPNGKYDDKTANAYYASVQLNPTLKKYSTLVEQEAQFSSGYFTDWNDVQLLLKISEDISGRDINFSDEELKALISLYNQPKVLGAQDAKTVANWKIKLIDRFHAWQTEGKLNEETLNSFMLVSNKTQILLEDYFLNKGFSLTESTDLSKATLYALLVGNYKKY